MKRKEYYKEYNKAHREEKRIKAKHYYYKNKESENNRTNIWRKNHKEYFRIGRTNNKEKLIEYGKKYYKKHIESQRNSAKTRYSNNKKKRISQITKGKFNNKNKIKYYNKKRYHSDPLFRINKCISSLIGKCLKKNKNGYKGENLVGYSTIELMNHLEKQFDDKMSGENYGSYGHIDHIKPKSLFHYESSEDKEFKECGALSNLQPLEKIANIKKGNKHSSHEKLALN